MKRRAIGMSLTALALVAGAGLLSGCAETRAEPVEVTYYYLPG